MFVRPTAIIGSAIVITVAVIAAACGGDDADNGAGPSGQPPVATIGADPEPTPEPTPAGDRGWLGGEPDWHAPDDAGHAGDGGELLADAAAAGDDRAGAGEVVADGGIADEPAPDTVAADEATDIAPEPRQSQGLTGGSIDDNVDFDEYLAYRDRIVSLGIPVRDLDPTGRVIVRVTGNNGLPVAGIAVTVSTVEGVEVASLRTTADGTIRFHPRFHGQDREPLVFAARSARVEAPAGADIDLVLDEPGGAEGAVPLDVVFLLDATGSMSDEIDRLKSTIEVVADRIAALDAAPDVRFGMTLYRDEGDAFVTSTFDLTPDLAAFDAALAAVVADGGGDYAEALDEGLAEALSEPAWRPGRDAIQLVFLVADAPPQVGRQVPVPYTESVQEAARRGIKIFPVASSDTDDQAEYVFRQMAQVTGGRFVFLTYGAGGRALGGSTDVTALEYEELALDDLIVRLVGEELAALTGDTTVVPSPVPATPPPDPNGN